MTNCFIIKTHMGLFSYLRRKFSKNIELGGDISDHLVFVYKLKKGKIWLGTNIIVPKEFAFVVGKDGKVLDVIPEGKHQLIGVNLPKAVKRFSLSKQLKDGSFPTHFQADAYFVNLKLFEYATWKAYRKIELFDEKYGYFNIGVSGAFAYQVVAPEIFLKNLFKVYDYLRQNEAEEILNGFVSEFVIEQIEKAKFDYESVKNLEKLTDSLFEVMSHKFTQFGVEIVGFQVEKVKFSKSFEKRVQKSVFDSKLLEENFEVKNNEPTITPRKKREIKPQIKLEEQEDLIPFTESIQNKSFEVAEDKSEFVDLTSPVSYNKEDQAIRCKFCGAKNDTNQEVCALCGESLVKRKF